MCQPSSAKNVKSASPSKPKRRLDKSSTSKRKRSTVNLEDDDDESSYDEETLDRLSKKSPTKSIGRRSENKPNGELKSRATETKEDTSGEPDQPSSNVDTKLACPNCFKNFTSELGLKYHVGEFDKYEYTFRFCFLRMYSSTNNFLHHAS